MKKEIGFDNTTILSSVPSHFIKLTQVSFYQQWLLVLNPYDLNAISKYKHWKALKTCTLFKKLPLKAHIMPYLLRPDNLFQKPFTKVHFVRAQDQ